MHSFLTLIVICASVFNIKCVCGSRVAAGPQRGVCCWPGPLQLLWSILSLQEMQVKCENVSTMAEQRKVSIHVRPDLQVGMFTLIAIFLLTFDANNKGNLLQLQNIYPDYSRLIIILLLCRRTLFRDSSILSHPVGEGASAFGHKKSSNLTGKN